MKAVPPKKEKVEEGMKEASSSDVTQEKSAPQVPDGPLRIIGEKNNEPLLSEEEFKILRKNYEMAQGFIVKLNERGEEIENIKQELEEHRDSVKDLKEQLRAAHKELVEKQAELRTGAKE